MRFQLPWTEHLDSILKKTKDSTNNNENSDVPSYIHTAL